MPGTDPFSALMETPPIFNYWITWIAIASIAILAGFRTYLRGPQYFSQTPLDGKIAIVTGGNRGIGYHVIQELARRGAKVYFGCRNQKLGEVAEKEMREMTKSTDIHHLDLKLGSLSSIRDFVKAIGKKESKVDILVCNAGVMCCPRSRSTDGFDYQLAINYIANYVLIEEMLPLLKAEPSRIVLLTSAAYQLGEIHINDLNLDQLEDYGNGSTAFGQSKLALMLLMNKLTRTLNASEVTVNAVHPGVVRTDIHRYMPLRASGFLYVSTLPVTWYLMKAAGDGAQTVNYACIDDAVKTSTGKYYIDLQEKAIDPKALDEDLADELWDVTKRMVAEADKRREEDPAVDPAAGDHPDEPEAGEDKKSK